MFNETTSIEIEGVKNIYNKYQEAIKAMDKCIEDLRELRETNPELAKKKAREDLQRAGILDKDGKLAPPYNGQKVNQNDFSRGPRGIRKLEQEER